MGIGLGGGCLCEPHDNCCHCGCHSFDYIKPPLLKWYGRGFKIHPKLLRKKKDREMALWARRLGQELSSHIGWLLK